MMPRQCTTAKPRIGPAPKISSARPAIRVVTLESTTVPKARSYPAWMAACGVAPLRISSRMRSLISTLASMAMPRVSAMAAMPGRVSVACSSDRIDRKSTRLNSSHTEIYTLSLHDALPISDALVDQHVGIDGHAQGERDGGDARQGQRRLQQRQDRSEEHTSELQSHRDLHSFPTRRSSDLGCAR